MADSSTNSEDVGVSTPSPAQQVQSVQNLLVALGSGDKELIKAALEELTGLNQTVVHQSVEELSTTFHSALSGLRRNLSADAITMTSVNIPEAAKKLEYVLKATEEASQKLLGLVERSEQMLAQSGKASERLAALAASDSSPLAVEARTFAKEHSEWLTKSRQILSDMVISQEFQDLCGQALKKILNLVRTLEQDLAALVRHFSVECPTDEQKQPAAISQSEVDDLLTEFGF